jgi:hypothetical protein
MKLSLSKSPILVTLVIVALAAGTALVAGYVDQPSQSRKACAASKCVDCPREGADTCCEATGVCGKTTACPSGATAEADGVHANVSGEVGTCAATKACASQEVKSACGATCEVVEAPSCPAGGCPNAK